MLVCIQPEFLLDSYVRSLNWLILGKIIFDSMKLLETLIHNSTVTDSPLSADVKDPTCLCSFEAKIFDLHLGTEFIPVVNFIRFKFIFVK